MRPKSQIGKCFLTETFKWKRPFIRINIKVSETEVWNYEIDSTREKSIMDGKKNQIPNWSLELWVLPNQEIKMDY